MSGTKDIFTNLQDAVDTVTVGLSYQRCKSMGEKPEGRIRAIKRNGRLTSSDLLADFGGRKSMDGLYIPPLHAIDEPRARFLSASDLNLQ